MNEQYVARQSAVYCFNFWLCVLLLILGVNQTFGGKIFKYGDVKVDVAGKNDIVFQGVKHPNKLRDYLKTREMDAENVQHVVTD